MKAQTNPLRDSLLIATHALEQHTDSVDLRLKRASWYLLLEKWNSAKDDYDLILAHYPNNVAALFFRAYANERLGRYGFARQDYNNLLKLVPGHFEAQLGLILLNQKDKHYTEAMDGINGLIEQYPTSAVAYAARAGMEEERGLLTLAEYDYTQAIMRDPNNTDYIIQRIEVYRKQKKYEQAKRDAALLRKMGIAYRVEN
ncbi:tetratricopeptide repeat protein [Prevotella bivia]|uniref:tetratricopeptide repeat protein n=1 Tax=Prevotella bivia TaxID=28125 RepID=UPI0038B6AAEE